MKVQEKGTDREAKMHLHAQGIVNELEEFGEYVDPNDQAICCYVPVEHGMTIKISGRFSGTTQTIISDCAVDGIYRNVSQFLGTKVAYQKNKKIEFETFLYQIASGVLDTEMNVEMDSINNPRPCNYFEGLMSALEVRVFVLRSFGVEHSVGNLRTYDNCNGSQLIDPENDFDHDAMYPGCKMSFEKNCAELDELSVKRLKTRMLKKRPGNKPWAIFRFYYRSRGSIKSDELQRTHNPRARSKSEVHVLDLEPVPDLLISSKLENIRSPTVASTPCPSSVPGTPANKTKRPSSPLSQKSQPKLATPTPTERDTRVTHERSPSPNLNHDIDMDNEADDDGSRKHMEEQAAKATSQDMAATVAKSRNAQKELTVNSNEELKNIEQDPAETPALKGPPNSKDKVQTANDDATEAITQSTEVIPEPAKPANLPLMSPSATPSSTLKTTATTATPPTTPAKRPSQLKLQNFFDSKRTKLSPTTSTTQASPLSSATPTTPKTPGLAATRKQLKLAKSQREQLAKKQAEVDEQLALYSVQINAAMDKLQSELGEEKRALKEEEQQFEEDAEMLRAFKEVEDAE